MQPKHQHPYRAVARALTGNHSRAVARALTLNHSRAVARSDPQPLPGRGGCGSRLTG